MNIIKMIVLGVKRKYCKYVVVDSYKTKQYCWTYREATSWFPYVGVEGNSAVCIDRHNSVIKARIVSNSIVTVIRVV